MITRTDDIKEIRSLLKTITGLAWSVKGSTGTAYSWITIATPPRRLVETSELSRTINLAEAFLLGDVLAERRPVHHQGQSVSPEARYGLLDTLRAHVAEGRTFDLATAEAKIEEARKAAKHTAEAEVSKALRQAAGAELADWQILEAAQTTAWQNSLPQAEGAALVAAAIELIAYAGRTRVPALDPSASAFLALAEG